MNRLLRISLGIILAFTVAGCAAASSVEAVSYVKSGTSTSVTDANGKFAFEIFKKLNNEDKNKNVFISPFSISTALAMTYQGAGSSTKEAMEKTLGFSGLSKDEINKNYKNLLAYLKQADKNLQLDISNSIWIRKDYLVKDSFIDINKSIFNASVTSLDFSGKKAADTMNNWIRNATKGKISKMIDSPIPKEVIMYLINAIYFKGQWSDPFNEKSTFDAKFNATGGKINEIKMMSRKGKMQYAKTDEYRAVRLPYGKGDVAMYCILPAVNADINSYIADMSYSKWQKIKKSLSETSEVRLQLPRFKIDYGIKNLNKALISLGMGEAFSDNADFRNISEDRIDISKVLHKALIEVNEKGTTAAAVTSVEVQLTAALLDPPEFIADRPFMFVIADDKTGSILFMGKLSNV